MRIFGILLILLGLVGIGAGVVSHIELDNVTDRMSTAMVELSEAFPKVTTDYTDVVELVGMDIAFNDLLQTEYGPNRDMLVTGQENVRVILDGMSDLETFEIGRIGGFGAGGFFFLVGLILFVIGGKKKKGAAAAA